mgnify:CR=1 FL=1
MDIYKLSKKTLFTIFGAIIFAFVGAIISIWLLVPPLPKSIVIATGSPTGLYHRFGESLKEELKKEGITVDMIFNDECQYVETFGHSDCIATREYFFTATVTKGSVGGKQMFFGKAYAHDIEGCPKGEDSVYLTPTSENPYDPFKLICQNEWGKYNHPKLVKAREQQAKDLKNGKWNYRSGGSGCKFSYWDQQSGKMKIFNDQIAKSFYQGN